MKRGFFLLASALILSPLLPAQTGPGGFPEPEAEFAGIRLGDDIGTVKKNLPGNPYFRYRGERDVSFLPRRPETVIDCAGSYQVKRGLFQFHQDRLYILTLNLDPEQVDYHSLFTGLSRKYGPPADLDPSGAVWESETLRLSLEKPLTVKYVDRGTFASIRAAGAAEKSVEDMSRARFLDLF